MNIKNVYNDYDLTLDPKRYSRKVVELRNELLKGKHFYLDDLVDFLPEKQSSNGEKISINNAKIYEYIEIQDIGYGDFYTHELRGWELPSRAKHFAESYDIYFGSIWGSVVKWCFIPQGRSDIVVTNGCFRCRMKEKMQKYLPDLLAYFNSEGWGVQMRAFARGSDGLAEICMDDAKKVIIPKLNADRRKDLEEYVTNLKEGRNTLNSTVKYMIKNHELEYSDPDKRPSHIVLV